MEINLPKARIMGHPKQGEPEERENSIEQQWRSGFAAGKIKERRRVLG